MTIAARPSRRAALGWAALLGAMFFVVYGAVNAYTATRTGVGSLYFPWEEHIPFLPWTVIPYMSSDLLFVAAFLMCRDDAELRRLAARVGFVILVSAACFLSMPLRYAFARPEAGGLAGALFSFLSWDLPYNQFPSLHISLAIVLWPVITARLHGVARAIAGAWFLMIAISTLTTFQHHAIDLAGGLLVGVLSLYVFPAQAARPVPITPDHRRMAWRFGAIAAALIATSVLVGGAALMLLYPVLSCLWVAAAYASGRSEFLHKCHGRYSLITWLLFAPYLLGSWLNWAYRRRRDAAWCEIGPGLLLGRRLNAREARQLIAERGIVGVVDLAPELAAPAAFTRLAYCHLPVLDFTSASHEQHAAARAFVASQRGPVYIHCALGYLRSVRVLETLLVYAGSEPAAVQALLRARRPRHVARSRVSQAESCRVTGRVS